MLTKIGTFMQKEGFDPDMAGYRYIMEACQIKCENPHFTNKACLEQLAVTYGTSYACIYYACKKALKECNKVRQQAGKNPFAMKKVLTFLSNSCMTQ